MPKDLTAIEAERDRLNKIIRAAAEKKERAELQKFVGRFFVYKNTFGCGDGGREWPLYLRIEKMSKDGGLIGTKFEVTTRDIRIEASVYQPACHKMNGYR